MDKKTNDEKMPYGVVHADCLDVMRRLPDNFIDAVVTDPPYGLSFMGKNWDHGVPGVEFWKEALRIAKPGAHLLSFGGTRTFHRIACAIEDAGWEIRDTIMWVYGSGFPKSMDISKAIEKKTGDVEEAKTWNGWGTCLKPAYEPVIMARNPLEGTVADTVLKYGTGGINIDECRVPFESDEDKKATGMDRPHTSKVGALAGGLENDNERTTFMPKQTNGRFPANIIHDGSEEVVDVFPKDVKGGTWNNTNGARHFENNGKPTEYTNKGSDNSVGSAARFFYTIKPECEPIIMARKPIEGTVVDNVLKYGTGGINVDECRVPYEEGGSAATNPLIRELHGCKNNHGADKGSSWRITGEDGKVGHANLQGRFPANVIHDGSEDVENLFPGDSETSPARFFYCSKASKSEKGKDNPHPTVKPLELMKYLIKMVAPKGALVLDPFMGSGSTGVAAIQIGRNFLGVEKEEEYFNYAKNRIEEAFLKSKNDV